MKHDAGRGTFPPRKDRPDAREALVGDSELLKQFGITRVGDVTDLDTIGVPVWFAARPNSRGISVAQGKGLTARQAKISAVMEAIEGAVAEDTQRHVREHGSQHAMLKRGMRVIPLETITRVDADYLDPERERAWVKGYSVRDGACVFAPYELVGMDFRADFPWDRQAFQMSSHGLAAGFDHDRTVLHALLELIEHDACFAVDAFGTRQLRIRPISFPGGASEALDDLLSRLEHAGLSARFFDLTNSNGIPVILAALPRSITSADGPGLRIAAGVACRLDMCEAVVAALLEAIQSRLTDISGARDDLSAGRYDLDMTVPKWHASGPASIVRPASVGLRNADPDAPLWRRVADHLFTAGVDDIYIFSLDSGVSGISVVRVIASGLAAAGGGLNRFSASALDSLLKR